MVRRVLSFWTAALLCARVLGELDVNVTVNNVGESLNTSNFVEAVVSTGGYAVQSVEALVQVASSDCPAGYYCLSSGGPPTPCPAGTYQNVTNAGDLGWCLACPVGLYCMLATVVPDACEVGTYRNVTGAGDPSECFACPGGYVCAAQRTVNPLFLYVRSRLIFIFPCNSR